MTRAFCSSLRAPEAITSKTAVIRDAVTLACWPPGPDDRAARTSTSDKGTNTPGRTSIGSSIAQFSTTRVAPSRPVAAIRLVRSGACRRTMRSRAPAVPRGTIRLAVGRRRCALGVWVRHATIRRVRSEQLVAAVRPFVESGLVPGAVVGVRHRGDTTVDSLGVTEPEGVDPLLVDAVVRISSNTKPMIAALTLLLAQDGVLALDDPVERFLPELAGRRVLHRLDSRLDDTEPARRSVTIEDLLTMRMGFGWVFESKCPAPGRAIELELGFGAPDPQGPPSPGEWIARFATLPLLESAGECVALRDGIRCPRCAGGQGGRSPARRCSP